jgi:hypothetical protein
MLLLFGKKGHHIAKTNLQKVSSMNPDSCSNKNKKIKTQLQRPAYEP